MEADASRGASREAVGSALGAKKSGFTQQFAVYVPNKRRNPDGGAQIEMPEAEWKYWINRIKMFLGSINRGATALAAADGYYIEEHRDKDGNEVSEKVHEKTVITYAYIAPEPFYENLSKLRALLHDFGRRAGQGSVFFDFDGMAFRISEYDALAEQSVQVRELEGA